MNIVPKLERNMLSSAYGPGDVRDRALRGLNSDTVASSGSILSPDSPMFYPIQGPFSYSQAVTGPMWIKDHLGWFVKLYYGSNNPLNQVIDLTSCKWCPITHIPTMPYKNSAIPNNGPHEKHGRGSHNYAMKTNSPHCYKPTNKHFKFQNKCGPKGRFGQILLDDMDVRSLEQAILGELNLDELQDSAQRALISTRRNTRLTAKPNIKSR